MKNIKKILFLGILVIYLIVVSGFISVREANTLCNNVNVIIDDSLSRRFINVSDVIEILSKNNRICLGDPLAKINTNDVEQLVLKNTIIKQCNVFTTIDGKLNIELEQREPIVRIIDAKDQSYYIDIDGSIINKSKRFTPHLLVVNGYISTPFYVNNVENIFDKKFDKKDQTLRDIYRLCSSGTVSFGIRK